MKNIFLKICLYFLPIFLMANHLDDLAKEAYIWGYPLVVTHRTMETMLQNASINSFNRSSSPSEFKEVINPNVDTLYASAWLDLEDVPQVLHVPAIEDRYYSIQFLDAYTNVFAYVGTQSTGNKTGEYLITGTHWSGIVPSNMEQIQSPTNNVWIIVRVFFDDMKDLNIKDLNKARNTLNSIKLTPLYPSRIPLKPLNSSDQTPLSFYRDLADALVLNSPPPDQIPFLQKLASIGISPGKLSIPNSEVQQALLSGIEQGEKQINEAIQALSKDHNGWQYSLKTGNYGTDYLLRAAIAKQSLGANTPEAAVYATALTDENGQKLNGANNYEINFEKPLPVDGFWSLTLYDAKTKGLFDNPRNRHALGDRTKELESNINGSIDIYLQSQTPNGKTQLRNWLPTPEGDYYLILRLYLPTKEFQEGLYLLPKIIKMPPSHLKNQDPSA